MATCLKEKRKQTIISLTKRSSLKNRLYPQHSPTSKSEATKKEEKNLTFKSFMKIFILMKILWIIIMPSKSLGLSDFQLFFQAIQSHTSSF